jgi:hypothetical protein
MRVSAETGKPVLAAEAGPRDGGVYCAAYKRAPTPLCSTNEAATPVRTAPRLAFFTITVMAASRASAMSLTTKG